jgi:hypothetical protein
MVTLPVGTGPPGKITQAVNVTVAPPLALLGTTLTLQLESLNRQLSEPQQEPRLP